MGVSYLGGMNIRCNSLPPKNTWSACGVPPRLDPGTIAQADFVTIHLDKPAAEDALLAAGMALAQGRPAVLAAPDRSHLPWFLQEADMTYPNRVLVVQTAPSSQAMETLKAELPAPPSKTFNTFIGCLMSGLTKEQYADGRSHLMEIHETLGQKLDSPNNYCEGIAVGSTDAFGSKKESLRMDLDAVQGSDQCIFYQYDGSSRPSGMWVELGAALAWGKPCTLLTPDLQGVPPAVRQGMPNLKVVEYGNHQQMLRRLQEQPESILPG